MNGESQVLVTEVVMFPVREREIEDAKNHFEKRNELTEIAPANRIKEPRFARLKKSLRKRSASIL